MKPTLIAAALVFGLASAQAAAAQAPSGPDRPPPGADHGQASAREAVKEGRQAPLSSVLKTIAKSHPGRQLNTTMGQSGGRAVYLVQWQLANGQIKVFTVDAQTGGLLSQ
jgi:uncharacterized membrane protein YkoI